MDEHSQAIEKNKALIHLLFEEIIHRGNLTIVDEIFSANFVDHSTPEQPVGHEGLKDYLVMVRTGFPDLHVVIDDLIAEGEKIVVRTSWYGTHLGTYEGVPPTGLQVARTLIQIFRIIDGKIAEEWNEGSGLLNAVQ
jgi:predicted ester cyclase